MAWTDSVAPNGFIDDDWRLRSTFHMRLFAEAPRAFVVNMSPDAVAAAHDYDIIAHNHSARLRRAVLAEERRVQGVDRDAARWARLCRRWASKHSSASREA